MNIRRNKAWRSLALFLCLVSIFGTTSVRAEEPTEPTETGPTAAKSEPPKKTVEVTAEEFAQMKLLILQLEARVKELESKGEKTEAVQARIASPSDASVERVARSVGEPSTGVPSPAPSLPTAKRQDASANSGAWSNFMRDWELSGFVDVYYGYNFNTPKSDTNILNFDNPLRNFDTKHNQFSLNMMKLVLEKKPTEDSRLGFRTDLAFGPATEIVHAGEPGGRDFIRYLQQAYLSYLAPVGKGLQIDFGKFVTHSGLELIETKDNWNYSRAQIFGLGPYYHFGVKATYPIHDKVTVMGGVVNGWNNVIENNTRRTFIAQVTVKPTDKLAIIHNYTGGPEQADNIEDTRHLFDGIVTFNATPKISLATNYIYGFDRVNGAKVHWTAIAGYAKFQLTDKLAFAPRFEVFRDNDGAPFITGTKQTLKGITLTGEYAIKDGLFARLEYRRDQSNKRFFPSGPDGVKNQDTLTLGVVYSFSSKK